MTKNSDESRGICNGTDESKMGTFRPLIVDSQYAWTTIQILVYSAKFWSNQDKSSPIPSSPVLTNPPIRKDGTSPFTNARGSR